MRRLVGIMGYCEGVVEYAYFPEFQQHDPKISSFEWRDILLGRPQKPQSSMSLTTFLSIAKIGLRERERQVKQLFPDS